VAHWVFFIECRVDTDPWAVISGPAGVVKTVKLIQVGILTTLFHNEDY